jgi:hypothetical protein
MGTQRVQMKGALPWLVRWIRRTGKKDIYALDALVSKVQIFFPRCTILI